MEVPPTAKNPLTEPFSGSENSFLMDFQGACPEIRQFPALNEWNKKSELQKDKNNCQDTPRTYTYTAVQ